MNYNNPLVCFQCSGRVLVCVVRLLVCVCIVRSAYSVENSMYCDLHQWMTLLLTRRWVECWCGSTSAFHAWSLSLHVVDLYLKYFCQICMPSDFKINNLLLIWWHLIPDPNVMIYQTCLQNYIWYCSNAWKLKVKVLYAWYRKSGLYCISDEWYQING